METIMHIIYSNLWRLPPQTMFFLHRSCSTNFERLFPKSLHLHVHDNGNYSNYRVLVYTFLLLLSSYSGSVFYGISDHYFGTTIIASHDHSHSQRSLSLSLFLWDCRCRRRRRRRRRRRSSLTLSLALSRSLLSLSLNLFLSLYFFCCPSFCICLFLSLRMQV